MTFFGLCQLLIQVLYFFQVLSKLILHTVAHNLEEFFGLM